jgi:hypothetical protein
MLSYYGLRGAVSFSTTEIGALVRQHYHMATYAAYLTAGEHQDAPNSFAAISIAGEIIFKMLSRDDQEDYLRKLHAPLNEAKMSEQRQASIAERALAVVAARMVRAFNMRAVA